MDEPAIDRGGHRAHEAAAGAREHGPSSDVCTDPDPGDPIEVAGLDTEPPRALDAHRRPEERPARERIPGAHERADVRP